MTEHLLHNPVYNALCGRDKHLGTGSDKVKYFDEEVSPFASFETGYTKGFADLYDMLPPKRGILYASPERITLPDKWKLLMDIRGVQMVHVKQTPVSLPDVGIVPLEKKHVEQMVARRFE